MTSTQPDTHAMPAITLPQSTVPNAPPNRVRDLGVLALAILAPVWGYAWVVMKVALDYSSPLTFVALRAGLSVPCLFLVLVVTRRSLRPPALGYTIVIGLLQTTVFMGLMSWALVAGGAGKVAVLTYTMPFLLLLLARAFLGERLRGTQWLAVGLAFAGLLLVVAPWQLHGAWSSALAVAGAAAWAASALVVKLLQRRQDVDVLCLTTWQLAFGSLFLILLAALANSGSPQWTAPFVGALIYIVLLGNVLAWALWLFALRALSAGAAGLGTLAIPVLGFLASWLQLGERPSAVEAAGMIAIVSGLAILSVRGIVAGNRAPIVAKEPLAERPLAE